MIFFLTFKQYGIRNNPNINQRSLTYIELLAQEDWTEGMHNPYLT